MTGQGALWLAKRYPSTLISVFLTGFRYFSYQAATQLKGPVQKRGSSILQNLKKKKTTKNIPP